MMDEETAEIVIDRLLLALAAQLDTSGSPALAAGAAEALADLSRSQPMSSSARRAIWFTTARTPNR
ncbi:hypothetical protein ACLQ3B_04790 [Micromonospora sp. DT53]|uniref:hypothetical protein n=1 Tax=Micromonospora sp. DT53 TaxID=3393444 RepID=UPI003CEA13EB